MEEGKESLEERAKEFIKLKIIGKFEEEGFNPIQIENVEDYIPVINYLLKKEYLIESDYLPEKEKTVKSLRYKLTIEGKEWTLS